MTTPHLFTCEEVFRRLDDYLDRELSAAEMELVTAHLDTCAVCAQEYRFEGRVLELIRDKLGKIQAPERLLQRVRQILDEERRKPG